MIKPNRPQTSGDVAGHYDELDRFYRDLWGEHVHHGLWRSGRETPEEACQQLIACLADELEISASDTVCDVGCGYGGTSRYLVRHHDAQVTGLTISAAQHEFATHQSNGSGNPRYLLENWESNGLADDSFDHVVSIECFSHLEDKAAYFEQIHRVLRPGGKAAITIWVAGDEPRRWEQRHLLEPICREGRLPSMCSKQECIDLLEGAGLRLCKYDDLSQEVLKTWKICARRLYWAILTRPAYWSFLLRRKSSHSIFLLTVYRILTAYRTGAMLYGLFVLEKPANGMAKDRDLGRNGLLGD